MLKKLSDRQLEIMEIMWEENRPMIASEIVSRGKDLNINTVQASLRSLMKKEYIVMPEVVYSGTVLSRSYKPCVSKERYIAEMCKGIEKYAESGALLASFIEKEDSMEVLDELERMIQERKSKL